jgi:hypothetical protein
VNTRACVCVVCLIAQIIGITPAAADVIVDWNELAVAQQDSQESSDKWSIDQGVDSIVPVAMFQAVNTIERRYNPYRQTLEPPQGKASPVAAAVAAAHAVLLKAYPGRAQQLDDAYTISLVSVPEGPSRTEGIALGERAAAQVIAWRMSDYAETGTPYRPPTQPGLFIVPALPTIPTWFLASKPWLLTDSKQFLPDRPPELKSPKWARDYNETKSLGGKDSTTRTPQQTLLARFWFTRRWGPTLRQVAEQPGRTLDQNARLYALVAMVEEDASLVHAEAKMKYAFWRPITAIRNGDQDGNDATERQPGWEPLIRTPMHPEYPCGHCVDSAATAWVLQSEGPPPPGGVAVTSEAVPGAVMYVQSYEDLANQIAESRIYAGAHFRSSVEAGQKLGRTVAEYALQNFLTPRT